MTPIIKLPQGTDFVNAMELPRLIVSALVTAGRLDAIPDCDPLLIRLEKKFPQAEPYPCPLYKLTEADLALLREIVPNSPFWSNGTMTNGEYAEFLDIFNGSPKKPEWELAPEFKDFRSETKTEHGKVMEKHRDRVDATIRGGKLAALTEHNLPAVKLEQGCIIAVDDARDYLAGIGFGLAQDAGSMQALHVPCEAQQNPNKSDLLAYLNQASQRFWANADRDDKGTHQANESVSKWLQDKGLSKRLADSGASIIRPKWAAVGRKPEE